MRTNRFNKISNMRIAMDIATRGRVVFLELRPDDVIESMFPSRDPERSKRLVAALDAVNGRFSAGVMRLGSLTMPGDWKMRRGRVSPSYTTRLRDILAALAIG
jgi:DNA polymerase V